MMLTARTLLLLPLTFVIFQACSDATGPAPDPFVPADITVELVTDAVDRPNSFAVPPDGSRFYVTEQYCCVRIVSEGQVLPEPFLDLRGQLAEANEWGLLGIAFHPEYPSSPYVYVSYTRFDDQAHVVERYTVESDGNSVDPTSATTVLSTPQPRRLHVGGSIRFGPEGMLWIAKGDAGIYSDEETIGNAQDVTTLHGTILRLDVDAGDPYEIPSDNPLVGREGRDEIWHYGLRNPWKFTIDELSGLLYIGDVGEGRFEEVNVVPVAEGGHNFGWDRMEGGHCFPRGTSCDHTELTLPVLEYPQVDECAVIGGEVYRGSEIPELEGHYLYTDLCGGWLRSFRFEDGEVRHEQEWTLPFDARLPAAFGVDAEGELYILSRTAIHRIVKADSGS